MRSSTSASSADPVELAARLDKVAAAAANDSGVVADLLGAFLVDAAGAIANGKRLSSERVERYQLQGAAAVQRNVDLPALIDLYLSAAWRLWREVPHLGVVGHSGSAMLSAAGEGMLRTSDDVVAAVAKGYQRASTAALTKATSDRREFVDDLLANHGAPGELTERAEAFGLRLAGPHRVVVAELRNRRIDEANVLVTRTGAAFEAAQGSFAHLVTSKDSRLIIVVGTDGDPTGSAVGQVLAQICSDNPTLRAGIGRAWPGEGGPMRSYLEAVDCLAVADRLQIDVPISSADDLLVFLSMFRNRPLLEDLVRSVLTPLTAMRGGAEEQLATLQAYFDSRGVATSTARALHLSVRGLTYRIERLRVALQHDLEDPHQRLTIELALVAARLLDWPRTPIADPG
jgi:hypothetical protein